MDIRTEGRVDPNNVRVMLDKNLPDDIRVIDVYEASSKLTDIRYASYRIHLDFGDRTEEASEIAKKLYFSPLVVTKKTKRGEKDIDITPMIKKADVRYEYGCTVIECVLCADSESYLNPFYLTGALEKELGIEAEHKRVMRTGVYLANETDFR